MHTRRLQVSFNTSEMACANFQREDDRGVLKVFAPCADPLYNNNTYLDVNDAYVGSDAPSWNNYEQMPLESFYPYDAPLLQSSLPSQLTKRDHIPRAWRGTTSFLPEDSLLYTPALSSPASSPDYLRDSDASTPSPIQLNEFTNVFDSDFALSARHGYRVSESPPLASIARRRYSHCSPSRSPRSLHSPHSPGSREPSPTNSENDPKRRFPCQVPGCSRRFTSQYTLKVHTEAHKPKPRASFPCTLGCLESFSRQHDRLRHEVAKHGKVCEFSCDECGRFFSSSKTLGNHKCPVAQGQTRWVHH